MEGRFPLTPGPIELCFSGGQGRRDFLIAPCVISPIPLSKLMNQVIPNGIRVRQTFAFSRKLTDECIPFGTNRGGLRAPSFRLEACP